MSGPPIPNGCGTDTTPWVPDGVGGDEFRGCCDAHDLDWAVGGVRGGILPWRVDGRWEWRFIRSNVGLSRCIRDRMARDGKPVVGWVAGPLYFAGTTLFGPIFWRWRSPTGGKMPTHEQLVALVAAETRGRIVA